MLVTSIFFFSHNVSKTAFSGSLKVDLCRKGLQDKKCSEEWLLNKDPGVDKLLRTHLQGKVTIKIFLAWLFLEKT